MVAVAALAAILAPVQPNIVLILADDLGWGELGCYGQTKIRTPNIDRLAQEGVRFERFYSSSPVCAPTRCSLLTGLHQGHAAIRGHIEIGGWGVNGGEGQWPLPANQTTLASRLKPLGYRTAVVGKWGLGGPGTEGHPLNHGFDHFFGYLCQRQAHNYYPTHLWNDHSVHILDGNRYFMPHQQVAEPPADYGRWKGAQYSADVIEADALRWLDQDKRRPFFLMFAATLPHAALQAPDDLVAQYPPDWDAKPYLGQGGYLPVERPRATYAAMVGHLDRTVGRILDALKASGRADDTLVVFTSDNGTAHNGGVDRPFFNSTGGLRGTKTQLFEGGIRVPMIARWPGKIPAGRTTRQLGAMHDLAPTLLGLAGGKTPKGLDGIDLAPVWRAERADIPRGPLYFEFAENPSQAVLLDSRWKAIRPRLRQSRTVELYDLQSDPAETTDVADSNPDKVRTAERLFRTMRRPNPLFPLPGIDPAEPPR